MISPKVVLLIFVSGKIVLTGAKVGELLYLSRLLLLSFTGARRDIPSFQSHLYGVMRIPQAVGSW